MSLFFQVDVPGDVEVFGGDHLLVFHCAAHNDATDPPVAEGRLVSRYWEAPQPPYPGTFWRVLMQGPGAKAVEEAERAVCARPLRLVAFEDSPERPDFKVGGEPSWAQFPEWYRCACGAELAFVCQVPEGVEFAVRPGLPEQPYSVRADTYNLFLGNEVYLLACPERCDPAAVWPVNQH